MDVGGVSVGKVGPEERIFELKSHCPRRFPVAPREGEQPARDVIRDAGRVELVKAPHRHAPSLDPGGGFFENGGHDTRVLRCGDSYVNATGPHTPDEFVMYHGAIVIQPSISPIAARPRSITRPARPRRQ